VHAVCGAGSRVAGEHGHRQGVLRGVVAQFTDSAQSRPISRTCTSSPRQRWNQRSCGALGRTPRTRVRRSRARRFPGETRRAPCATVEIEQREWRGGRALVGRQEVARTPGLDRGDDDHEDEQLEAKRCTRRAIGNPHFCRCGRARVGTRRQPVCCVRNGLAVPAAAAGFALRLPSCEWPVRSAGTSARGAACRCRSGRRVPCDAAPRAAKASWFGS